MRSIAQRLLGPDAGRLLDLILGKTPEERGAVDRVRDAAEWCGTTPGSVPGTGAGRPLRTRASRGPVTPDRHWRG